MREAVLRDRIFQCARDVVLTDEIVKRLRPIFSGENLVTHFRNLIVMSSEVETSRSENDGSVRVQCSASAGSFAAELNKEAPPVSRRGPLSNCPNYRVIVMQQAPGQQAPPSQQPASLDEIVVTLVSVIIAAIKSRYFIKPPFEIS